MNYGGIEAGGTRWVCAVVEEDRILAREVFPTTGPDETIGRALEFFAAAGPLAALGIGSFGPIDLDAGSPGYGQITTTPKPGWAQTNVLAPFRDGLGIEVHLDTDVNVAALAERRWGEGVGLRSFVYLTVGTGIGGGVVVNDEVLGGTSHPEIGHLRVPHDLAADPFPGSCPYHGDCLEGLASGESLRRRWGKPAEELTESGVWKLEAEYLAYGLVNLVHTLAPERIIIGGGVSRRPGLHTLVHEKLVELIAGYVDLEALSAGRPAAKFVVPPALGEDSGVLGAAELARSGRGTRATA